MQQRGMMEIQEVTLPRVLLKECMVNNDVYDIYIYTGKDKETKVGGTLNQGSAASGV